MPVHDDPRTHASSHGSTQRAPTSTCSCGTRRRGPSRPATRDGDRRRSAEGIGAISEYRGAGCDMLRMLRYDVYRTRVPSLWRAALWRAGGERCGERVASGWLFGSIKSGCDATMRRRLPSTGAHGAI
jgi:hypothetical protein